MCKPASKPSARWRRGAARAASAGPLAALAAIAGCATAPPSTRGAGFRDCADCPERGVIPAGAFRMGFDGGEPERCAGTVREVRIARAFAQGRPELTVAQFRAFVAATGYRAVARPPVPGASR